MRHGGCVRDVPARCAYAIRDDILRKCNTTRERRIAAARDLSAYHYRTGRSQHFATCSTHNDAAATTTHTTLQRHGCVNSGTAIILDATTPDEPLYNRRAGMNARGLTSTDIFNGRTLAASSRLVGWTKADGVNTNRAHVVTLPPRVSWTILSRIRLQRRGSELFSSLRRQSPPCSFAWRRNATTAWRVTAAQAASANNYARRRQQTRGQRRGGGNDAGRVSVSNGERRWRTIELPTRRTVRRRVVYCVFVRFSPPSETWHERRLLAPTVRHSVYLPTFLSPLRRLPLFIRVHRPHSAAWFFISRRCPSLLANMFLLYQLLSPLASYNSFISAPQSL